MACNVLKAPLGVLRSLGLPAAALSTSSARGPLSSLLEALTSRPDAAYATHVPLNKLQKGAVALVALAGAFADPRRGDLVAAAGETTALPLLPHLRDRMLRSDEGRQVLADKPRVTWEAVKHCWDMPDTTFGGAYAKFMGDRRFLAGDRPPVHYVDDPELAYVITRIREVHDYWHVLFGCHTNGFGEAALKAVEFIQTGIPMTGLAVVAGEFKQQGADRELLNREFLPWALKAGTRSADLLTIYYEKHFEEDLDELRQRWRISVAPQAPQNQLRRRMQTAEAAAVAAAENAVKEGGSSGGQHVST